MLFGRLEAGLGELLGVGVPGFRVGVAAEEERRLEGDDALLAGVFEGLEDRGARLALLPQDDGLLRAIAAATAATTMTAATRTLTRVRSRLTASRPGDGVK